MLANQNSGSSLPQRSQSRPATRWSHALRRRAAHRRPAGIILLVVLVLLALFTMLLISFVVATVSNRQSVIQSARVEQTGDSPQAQLYDAFMQVVRGPRDSNSVMGPHSLLEDIYGHNAGAWPTGSTPNLQQGVRGVILPGPTATSIGYFTLQDSNNGNMATGVPYMPGPTAGTTYALTTAGVINNTVYPHTPILAFKANILNDPMWSGTFVDIPPYGYYSGRLITMLTGPAANRTGRIVGYYYNNSNSSHYLQVLGFDGIIPDPGDKFLINGRPFSGTGFGYRPRSFFYDAFQTRLLDACLPNPPYPSTNYSASRPDQQPGFQYALLPNPRRGVFEPTGTTASLLPMTDYLDPAGPGGAHEDYDAPDFQNMLLAMRVWSYGTLSLQTPLPSLHRPDLLSYWNDRWKTTVPGALNHLFPSPNMNTDSAYDALTSNSNPNYFLARNLLRKITLRPLSLQDDPNTSTVDESENPNFTGSNPNFNLVSGPWDVDNDGDGVPDSIWVDLGMPVQQSPDGRRYKPLFAILCLDMDGKLNVNAHSSVRHVPPDSRISSAPSRFSAVNGPFTVAGAYILKVGSGYGPAEISLHPIFEPALILPSTPLIPNSELYNLLFGFSSLAPISPYSLPPSVWIEGRYGEMELGQAIGVGPKTGMTWIDDPANFAREMNLPQIRSWSRPASPFTAQRQLPYLPIHISTTSPYIPIPLSIDNTMWATGNPQTIGGYWTQGYGSAYGTPPDLDGDGMIALDLRGQPMYIDYPANNSLSLAGEAGWGEPDESIDDPYEFDLSLNAPLDGYTQSTGGTNFTPNGLNGANYIVSVDAPFTAAELERILRWRDADAPSLPDRLIRLAPLAFTSPNPLQASNSITGRNPYFPEIAQMPNLITHASFDLPAPSMIFTSPDLVHPLFGLHAGSNFGGTNVPPPMVNSNITQLLAARIGVESVGTFPPTPGASTITKYDPIITQLLPPELIAGERMNINRPLGNGHDDNNNGIIDEPGEIEFGWSAVTGGNPTLPRTGVQFDLANAGDVFTSSEENTTANPGQYVDKEPNRILDGRDNVTLTARQTMARHLYTLMMLLADHNTFTGKGLQFPTADYDSNGTPGEASDTAYYFAQWAVNIVDFFDSDSIMTPFEFDITPFQYDGPSPTSTWNVDGIVLKKAEIDAISDDLQSWRGLVWGCERPELLITETIATHDRRTVDSNNTSINSPAVNASTGPDKDFDQVRRPQGSLIVELFNPNPPFTVGGKIMGEKPSEMYTGAFSDPVTNAPQFGVNLAQVYPTSNVPVWRLAVRPRVRVMAQQTLPLRNPVLASPSNLEIDRVLYFTQQPGGRYPCESLQITQFYLPPNVNPIVPPNHYAIVGPAARDPYDTDKSTLVTHLGWRDYSQDSVQQSTTGILSSANTSIHNRYHARIQYTPFVSSPSVTVPFINVWDDIGGQGWPKATPPTMPTPYLTSRSTAPVDVKPCVAIPVATTFLNGAYNPVQFNWTARTATPAPVSSVRWSVTEPDAGYPIPIAGGVLAPGDQYDDNGYYTASAVKDTPFDSAASPYFASTQNDKQRILDIINSGNSAKADQTIPLYTVVCLQRLANPTLQWDPNANPYITVDQMWVDLTTYNSEKGATPVAANAEFPGMVSYTTLAAIPNQMTFDTRRRLPAYAQIQGNYPAQANNIWFSNVTDTTLQNLGRPSTLGKTPLTPIPTSTLGYLNNEYGSTGAGNNRYTSKIGTGGTNPATYTWTGPTAVDVNEYRGDPTTAFPWLNWNNRPYVSGKELMLVPLSSPSSLSAEITSSSTGTTWAGSLSVNNNPYEQTGMAQPTSPNGEFGHLANVFHSPQYDPTKPGPGVVIPRDQYSTNFYRLLEYIHVPSRFTGTEDFLPAAQMLGVPNDPNHTANNPQNLPVHQLHPPFNRVSRFRDPGRVNINTVLDPFVMQGILDEPFTALQSTPPWSNLWRAISQSRLGTNLVNSSGTPYQSPFDTSTNVYFRTDIASFMNSVTGGDHANPPLPTIFGSPFRSYSGRTLVPIDAMRREETTPWPTPPTFSAEREVDATLLRALPYTSPGYPLLEYPGPGSGNYNWRENPNAINEVTRNPYFTQKPFRRLDNLLTTRSNVYSVWITVGYFEVTPAPSNDPQRSVKYPDGWVLGQEVGADTGDIQRHRAFYMYDRSIPVGFERGENHNVNKGILLERFIE